MEKAIGKCVICSAPSGSGKTTIVRYLLKAIPELTFSVSATTRPRRTNEVDGVDYHFLSTEQFRDAVDQELFVEWEEVYPGRCYGTLRTEVERSWDAGRHVIFDVDVIGGLRLKASYGPAALGLFISPPSLQALAHRLRTRGTETEETLAVRLAKAGEEMERASSFDAIIVNDDLSQACVEAEALVRDFLSR